VSQEVLDGRRKPAPIKERRPPEGPAGKDQPRLRLEGSGPAPSALSHPVWRCRVCGYLCARDAPPEVCPICKAKKDRFERFL
jgi:ferredoxin-thioredoxin reductase catalytic chain